MSIDIHSWIKQIEKEEKFKYSGYESQRVDHDQKRELQKYNETVTPLAVTVTAIMLRFGLIEACGENKMLIKSTK